MPTKTRRPASSRKPKWQAPLVTTKDTPKPRGAWFDPEAARRAVDFFALLPLIDGPHAGEPFKLQPWQEMEIVRPLFGWKKADGTRLYRELYLRVARKNAKSTLCAGIAGYLTFADDEPGARVYACAVDTAQAREVFDTFRDMVRGSQYLSPNINPRVKTLVRSVEYEPQHIKGAPARFHILSGETKSKDGLNIHGGIIDELHAHPSRDMYDLLNQGTASRRQPLIASITTAGVVAEDSVCLERDEYTRKVATRQLKDPAFLGVIYAMEEGDDWRDPQNWKKANPGLGVTIPIGFLKRECAKAEASPAAQNAFRMKHANEWMQQHTRWIDLGLWDAQASIVNEAELRGRTCYGGLDIGSVSDLTAWVMVFPNEPGQCKQKGHEAGGCLQVLPRFFVPSSALEKGKQNAELYRNWQRDGLITVTEGERTDYDFVDAQVIKDATDFWIAEANMDFKFQGLSVWAGLEDSGIPMRSFGRSAWPMPMKELEGRLLERGLHHGGHPVLRWMADNIVVRMDPDGNLKPDRDKSRDKIDGIVSLVMALEPMTRGSEGGGLFVGALDIG